MQRYLVKLPIPYVRKVPLHFQVKGFWGPGSNRTCDIYTLTGIAWIPRLCPHLGICYLCLYTILGGLLGTCDPDCLPSPSTTPPLRPPPFSTGFSSSISFLLSFSRLHSISSFSSLFFFFIFFFIILIPYPSSAHLISSPRSIARLHHGSLSANHYPQLHLRAAPRPVSSYIENIWRISGEYRF